MNIEQAIKCIPGWQTLHVWFSSYWCANFVKLFSSQKSNFLIFRGLTGLIKTKKTKYRSKLPNIVTGLLFKQFQEVLNIFLLFAETFAFASAMSQKPQG